MDFVTDPRGGNSNPPLGNNSEVRKDSPGVQYSLEVKLVTLYQYYGDKKYI